MELVFVVSADWGTPVIHDAYGNAPLAIRSLFENH